MIDYKSILIYDKCGDPKESNHQSNDLEYIMNISIYHPALVVNDIGEVYVLLSKAENGSKTV